METEALLVTQRIPSVFYNMSLCSFSHQWAKRLNCFRTQRKRDVQTKSTYTVSWWKCADVITEKNWQLFWEERTIETWQIIFPTTAPCSLCRTTCGQDQLHKGSQTHTAALGQRKHKINSVATIHSSKAVLHTYRTNNVFWCKHLTQSCIMSDFACRHHTSLLLESPSSLPLPLFLFPDVQCGSS